VTHSALSADAGKPVRDMTRLPPWLASRSVVCLDFDGVMLDSNEFKVGCMREALSDFSPKVVECFLEYFRKNFGNARQLHFQVFYERFSRPSSDFETFYATYGKRYAGLVSEGYAELSLTEGCEETLLALRRSGIANHIVTGGDPKQVQAVLESKSIRSLVKTVRGAPGRKANHIADILREESCSPDRSILFGDGVADCCAAMETGLDFVFVSRFSTVDLPTMQSRALNFRLVMDLSLPSLAQVQHVQTDHAITEASQ